MAAAPPPAPPAAVRLVPAAAGSVGEGAGADLLQRKDTVRTHEAGAPPPSCPGWYLQQQAAFEKEQVRTSYNERIRSQNTKTQKEQVRLCPHLLIMALRCERVRVSQARLQLLPRERLARGRDRCTAGFETGAQQASRLVRSRLRGPGHAPTDALASRAALKIAAKCGVCVAQHPVRACSGSPAAAPPTSSLQNGWPKRRRRPPSCRSPSPRRPAIGQLSSRAQTPAAKRPPSRPSAWQ